MHVLWGRRGGDLLHNRLFSICTEYSKKVYRIALIHSAGELEIVPRMDFDVANGE